MKTLSLVFAVVTTVVFFSCSKSPQPAAPVPTSNSSTVIPAWASQPLVKLIQDLNVEGAETVSAGEEGRKVTLGSTVVARITILSRDAKQVYFVQLPVGASSGVFTIGPKGPRGINSALEGLGIGGQRVIALASGNAFPHAEWAPNVPARADVIIIAEVLDIP